MGERSAGEVWRRQLRWARLRRDAFKLYFIPEILTGGVPPLLAGAFVAFAAGVSIPAVVTILAAIWYGGEVLLAYSAGWHLTRRSPLLWMLRDLTLPVLWVMGWLGNGFVWRGNAMRVADRTGTA